MRFQIKISSFKTLDELKDYWSADDYIQLLDLFNFPDAASASKDSLRELLMMAITDFEPNEAAAIILEYKLSEELTKGQIDQISNDMLLDKISEEYPEIHLHSRLFHINQLLFKAFNGKFPNIKASQFDCTITPLEEELDFELTKEAILKLMAEGLSDSNLIKRLFTEKMSSNSPFPEAADILWDIESTDGKNYKILTSEYWLSNDDLIAEEFEGNYEEPEASEKE